MGSSLNWGSLFGKRGSFAIWRTCALRRSRGRHRCCSGCLCMCEALLVEPIYIHTYIYIYIYIYTYIHTYLHPDRHAYIQTRMHSLYLYSIACLYNSIWAGVYVYVYVHMYVYIYILCIYIYMCVCVRDDYNPREHCFK